MKFASTLAVLTAAVSLDLTLVGCGPQDEVVFASEFLGNGSLRLALETGGQKINTVTATISGERGFKTQTHTIDVSGDNGMISIFFGELPEGDYEITLAAGGCSGSSEFSITADETEFVNVVLVCGEGSDETGGVQVTGTILEGSLLDCDHVLKVVAAPSVQVGNGPVPAIEVFLNHGVVAKNIAWSQSSSDGGSGAFLGLSGSIDTEVTFDCSTNGHVAVTASITAPCDFQTDCVQQARAVVECRNQTGSAPVCGDNIVNQTSEQCDGTAPFPAGTPAGSTCSPTCTIVPPTGGPRCGDNVINQTSEQCDGTAPFPAGTPAGSTCSPTCTIVPPTGTGACLACAQASCTAQYAASVGSTDATMQADIAQLFACVIGSNWQAGAAIPASSCYFSDPQQPLGSLVPCYCGSTPQATCLATGPTNNQDACGLEVERASRCNPVAASCVTSSGSNPAVPLGAALQLLNCERAACPTACGFPAPMEE